MRRGGRRFSERPGTWHGRSARRPRVAREGGLLFSVERDGATVVVSLRQQDGAAAMLRLTTGDRWDVIRALMQARTDDGDGEEGVLEGELVALAGRKAT